MVWEQPLFRFAALFLVAFVPSLLYTIWIRNTERYSREPWLRVIGVFLWGAVFAIIISIVLEILAILFYQGAVVREYQLFADDPTLQTLVIVCIIAPIVEEAAKGYGVHRKWRFMRELEDGLVYGAACGLGFAATENLLYEAVALEEGIMAFITLAIVRSVSSSLLHASATAVTGYGVSRRALGLGRSVTPFYLLAVLMHSLFNLLASYSLIMDDLPLLGLFLVVLLSWLLMRWVRGKIRELDMGPRGRRPMT